METIWDYNPTDEELIQAFGSPDAAPGADVGEDTRLAALAFLFLVRGHDRKARAFAKQIKDPDYQFDILLSLQKLY